MKKLLQAIILTVLVLIVISCAPTLNVPCPEAMWDWKSKAAPAVRDFNTAFSQAPDTSRTRLTPLIDKMLNARSRIWSLSVPTCGQGVKESLLLSMDENIAALIGFENNELEWLIQGHLMRAVRAIEDSDFEFNKLTR